MDGKALKLQRVEADVRGVDLARAMRVSPSWVSRIENSRVVTRDTADRYLAALVTCRTTITPEAA